MSFDSNVSLRDCQKILHINNDDIAVTRAIVEAGKNLDVSVLDHIIIGCGNGNRWVSLKERRLGFDSGNIHEKRSSYQVGEAVVKYDVSPRIIEALPGENVIFPDEATEDTWHLFLNAFAAGRCPTCAGKGGILPPAGGVQYRRYAKRSKGMPKGGVLSLSKGCNHDLRPCPECGGRGSLE